MRKNIGASFVWRATLVAALLGTAGCLPSLVNAGGDAGGGADVPDGQDGATGCGAGSELCAGGCVDTASNSQNCGACGRACNTGEVCVAGTCGSFCPSPRVMCGSDCVDTQSSNEHCGGCASACGAGELCVSGACGTFCPSPRVMCGANCVDTQTSSEHCGGCNAPCVGGTCLNGACECPSGQSRCNGACVDTASSLQNCGACGTACAAGQVCTSGTCTSTCGLPNMMCGALCVDPLSDEANCGMCNNRCAAGMSCSGGSCACTGSLSLCSGQCVDTQSNPANCGTCGRTCAASQTCTAGTCACAMGQQLCNGTCADTTSDPANCGACGNACGGQGAMCINGACDRIVQISAGEAHTCALRSGGGVVCWGENARQQLGDGTTTPRTTPVAVLNVQDAIELAAGLNHTCALRRTGQVTCWGDNGFGQLGNAGARPTPGTNVPGITDAVQISGRLNAICARRASGQISCWGDNQSGQFGNGTTGVFNPTPVTVPGINDAAEIAVGSGHTCVRRAAGNVVCWGANYAGQLGIGMAGASQTSPGGSVLGFVDAVHIAAGNSFSCAIRAMGQTVCWGRNSSGELGNGSIGDSPSPVNVLGMGSTAYAVTAGSAHACILANGSFDVWCWGSNNHGQLGDGTQANRSQPALVPGTSIGRSGFVSGGTNHTCAVGTNVQCWGSNMSGQVGDGSTSDRLRPVPVVGL